MSLSAKTDWDILKLFKKYARYFKDHLCYLCLVFVILLRLFIAALWLPERKGLTSWLVFCDVYCDFVTFPFGVLGQVWFLIVSIPDP